ncbi:hypothetical protein ASF63_07880 [Microbacterium sp. Leaf320]|nr:hypothetical protein ASF63_07880 [Microbacterium sp. Leaf320]
MPPASAAAAETIVLNASAQLQASEIPAGKYLKVTETFDQVVGFHGRPTEAEPFSYVLQDATGVLTTRWVTSTYLSSDAEVPPIVEDSLYQPVVANGEVQAVEEAWNSYYGDTYGLWDDIIDTPRPSSVFQMEGAYHAGLWSNDPAEVRPIDDPDDSRVDDWGAFASDPQEFLDGVLAEFPEVTTKEDAVAMVFESLVNGNLATASASYRAVLLGVIALSDGLEVESVQGTVTTVRFDDGTAIRRLVFDTETDQLVEVSQYLAEVPVPGTDELVPVGTSPLVEGGAPTTIRRFTQEIVDAPPAIDSAG